MPSDEPSWHRRAQRRRQTARAVVQAADSFLRIRLQLSRLVKRLAGAAAAALDHHGSKVLSSVANYLQGKVKGGRQDGKS